MIRTAILVDGGFYRQRRKIKPELEASVAAEELFKYCMSHVDRKGDDEKRHLYRIFYYDCKPLDKTVFHPLTKKEIILNETKHYIWMNNFLKELNRKRKLAIRLGVLAVSKQKAYNIRPEVTKRYIEKDKNFKDLKESDFSFLGKQKGVDMRIGLDIASLAYKRIVNQIILISGDSDFVPAAKLARTEGIDFILDPMNLPIQGGLVEHVDGIETMLEN